MPWRCLRDRVVLGIKNEQTTKKLLLTRDLTLNKCIDICRSEEVTDKQSRLAEPEDINQVESKGKNHRVSEGTGVLQSGKKVSCNFMRQSFMRLGTRARQKEMPGMLETRNRCKGKNILLRNTRKPSFTVSTVNTSTSNARKGCVRENAGR